MRAGITRSAQEYVWSSTRAHLLTEPNKYLSACPVIKNEEAWKDLLQQDDEEEVLKDIRRHVSSGKIMGDENFLKVLSAKIGYDLAPRKPGPKAKVGN